MEADEGRSGVRQLGRATDSPSDDDGTFGSDGDALPPRKSARSRTPRCTALSLSVCELGSASLMRDVTHE